MIFYRVFSAGAMERETVIPSLSPSMDIQVSSNFERLLFEVLDRDSRRTANLMDVFSSSGKFQIDQKTMSRFKKTFAAFGSMMKTQIELQKL